MLGRYSSLVVLLFFFLHGCASQVISKSVQKGMLVKEEGSGKFVERSRKKAIEQVSPFTVRVHEQVELVENTKLYYQKMLVKKTATPREYSYMDLYLKVLLSTAIVPLFTSDYWVQGSYNGVKCGEEEAKCAISEESSALWREYFIEEGNRPIVQRVHKFASNDTVALFINGYYKGELRVDAAGTATVNLLAFPELEKSDKDLKLTFKYFDAFTYSLINKNDVAKIFHPPTTPIQPPSSR